MRMLGWFPCYAPHSIRKSKFRGPCQQRFTKLIILPWINDSIANTQASEHCWARGWLTFMKLRHTRHTFQSFTLVFLTCSVEIWIGAAAILTEVFRNFPQSLQGRDLDFTSIMPGRFPSQSVPTSYSPAVPPFGAVQCECWQSPLETSKRILKDNIKMNLEINRVSGRGLNSSRPRLGLSGGLLWTL